MKLSKLVFPEGAGIEEKRPIVIAGPCSVESRTQILETAQELSEKGIKILRAGIWKPRTKPGGFEGVGGKGLEWLSEAKSKTGMLIATEVATPAHWREVNAAGIDLVWIGARTVTNPFAVQQLADAMQGTKIPVLVKNPTSPDLELWCGALERFYNASVTNLGAIHRGFSSDGEKIYRNDPIWHIPIELKRRYPELTIFCDPSHMGGKRELIAPISQQAMDINFDGLFIESHCSPETALSDASQQITPAVLDCTLNSIVIRDNTEMAENLSMYRRKIDEIDEELLKLLSKRMGISREIGLYKKEHGIAILQSARYGEILSKREKIGSRLQLSGEFVEDMMKTIHEESVKIQMEVMK